MRSSITRRLLGRIATPIVLLVLQGYTAWAQNLIATIPVGNTPGGVAANPLTHRIYVINQFDPVSVIDGSPGSPTENQVIATALTGSGRRYAAVNPNLNRVYITRFFSQTLTVLNGETNAPIATVQLVSNPLAVAVNTTTNNIYVANTSGLLIGVVVIGGTPGTFAENLIFKYIPLSIAGGIAANPTTNLIYVVRGVPQGTPHPVAVIDGVTNKLLPISIPVGGDPSTIAVDPTTNRVFVTNGASNTVSVIDGNPTSPRFHTVIKTISVGNGPAGIDIDTSTHRVYVANASDRTVSVIDDCTLEVVATKSVTPTTGVVGVNGGLAVDSSTHRIYVSHQQANVVSVLADEGWPPNTNLDLDLDGIQNDIDGMFFQPILPGTETNFVCQASSFSHGFTDRDRGGTTSGMVFDALTPLREPLFLSASIGNFNEANRNSNDIDSIVIHFCVDTFHGCIKTFQNPTEETSAHYVISKYGEIVQMVNDKDIAFHATYYNSRSIGIELEGFGKKGDFTDAMYESLANLIAKLRLFYPMIPLTHPPDEEKATTVECLNVKGIVGHQQVQPADLPVVGIEDGEPLSQCGNGAHTFKQKPDPGPNFDWGRVINRAIYLFSLNPFIRQPIVEVEDADMQTEGVLVTAPGGGLLTGTASVVTCQGTLQLTAGDSVIVTCDPLNNSLTAKVLTGPVEILLGKDMIVAVPGGMTVKVAVFIGPLLPGEQRRFQITGTSDEAGTVAIAACGSIQLLITSGDSVIVLCGSLTAEVLVGPVEILLGKDIVVTVPSGTTVKVTEISEGKFEIENSPDSERTVSIQVRGQEAGIVPVGSTVHVSSNHPPIAVCQGVTVPTAPGVCTASASVNNGSSDPDGDQITLVQSPAEPYSLGNTAVTLTVTDTKSSSNACVATVTVVDAEPPALTCPAPQVVECTGPRGALVSFSATAADNCPGAVTTSCTPLSGTTIPLGSTPVSCRATDASGNASVCGSTMTVRDTTPPVISSVAAQPNVLWPPNHTMVPVTLSTGVADTCDEAPTCRVLSVSSNEPVEGLGDGDMAPDWEITGAYTVNLRAERAGTGSGRIYTITVACADASGNNATKTVAVAVPHDSGKAK